MTFTATNAPDLGANFFAKLAEKIMLDVQAALMPQPTWTMTGRFRPVITLSYTVGPNLLRLIARPDSSGLYITLYEGHGNPEIGEGITHAWGLYWRHGEAEPTIEGTPACPADDLSFSSYSLPREIGRELSIPDHAGRPNLVANIADNVRGYISLLS